jgi:hypothetical protein
VRTHAWHVWVASLLLACDSQPLSPPEEFAAIDQPIPWAVLDKVNVKIPIALTQFVPCADGGQGEDVALTGNLHVLFQFAISNSGQVTLRDHSNPQGVVGTGLSTGDTYRGTGVTQSHDRLGQVGESFTFVNNFRIIGRGPGNNFTVHETIHVTVNANGNVTVSTEKARIGCK